MRRRHEDDTHYFVPILQLAILLLITGAGAALGTRYLEISTLAGKYHYYAIADEYWNHGIGMFAVGGVAFIVGMIVMIYTFSSARRK